MGRSRLTLSALALALVASLGGVQGAGSGCDDVSPKRTLAIEFAGSVADGRRALSPTCTEGVVEAVQWADVPFIVSYVLVGGFAAFRLAPFTAVPVALAVGSITAAGVCDLLEDASILRIAGYHSLPPWIAAGPITYGWPKWALFYLSSVMLSCALAAAAIGTRRRRSRALLGGATVLAATGGVGGLWALHSLAFETFAGALMLWFFAVMLSLLADDSSVLGVARPESPQTEPLTGNG